jgi:hypothetical protein
MSLFKTGAVCSSETSKQTKNITQRKIPKDDHNLDGDQGENLKTYTTMDCFQHQ